MIGKNYIRVLYIDLNNKSLEVRNRKDLTNYLGGVGIASKLLEENIRPDLKPLDDNQPIIFAIGAISSIYPVITKTVSMFYSPLTMELGESYAGGRMAISLLFAGYDAIVITGKSHKPIYLSISSKKVKFKDARALWGLSTNESGRFIRERELCGGMRSILRIGPAGENLSSFANVCVDTYRHFGRLGLGAVFGSKNLKAIVTMGEGSLPINDYDKYIKTYSKIYKRVTSTKSMQKYHDLGTSANITTLNEINALPTKNLTLNKFKYGNNLSGEEFANRNLVRKMACTGCPVGCIHIGQFRRQFDRGYDYESVSVAYDYELIFALGSYLGISSTEGVLQLIEIVEEMGLDAISTGVSLGWTTEAYSKGLISNRDTLFPIEYGNMKNYISAINYIAIGKNEFYKILGKGCAVSSKIYGGEDFALHYAGNETPGYHTGYGSLIGHAVGARHSHLCNGGYSIDQKSDRLDKEELIDSLFNEEIERCLLNSLIICLFARKVYDRDTILMALSSSGYNLSNDDLTNIANEIYRTKLKIKTMIGFDLKNIKLPRRLFQTPSLVGRLEENTGYELIHMYNNKIKEFMS